MKKLISIVVLGVMVGSCNYKAQPIEKYKGAVVIGDSEVSNNGIDVWIRCKTKDSLFYIKIAPFDAKDLKIGDTIK